LSAWSAPLGPQLVLLSANQDNGYRSRFDLAQELGQLILHRGIERPTDRERYNELELQANRFAGAFRLPAETFAPLELLLRVITVSVETMKIVRALPPLTI
jgi:Zn-dependent peptidase ImmA (M78 family)